MRGDYLWDGSGEPDPEIQQLESALGKLRHRGAAPAFSEIPALGEAATRPWFLLSLWPRLAIAAAAVLFAVFLMVHYWPKPVSVARSGWDVTPVEGAPQVSGRTVATAGGASNLGVGQVLETDRASRATIDIADTGEVQVDPGTRLRLLKSTSGVKRLALERGTIHATIWADPGEFVVDTPSAVAVDLGCVYTLHVDDSGDGLLRTTLGWVGFQFAGHEAFIPAGAACATKRKTGLGTPYFEDASEAFRAAVAKFDSESSTEQDRAASLETILTQSRKRDALTLWHLLARVPAPDRIRVYDRLAKLVPAPSGVTREGVLRLDRQMLDQWWDALDFGDVSLWRHWERSWSQQK